MVGRCQGSAPMYLHRGPLEVPRRRPRHSCRSGATTAAMLTGGLRLLVLAHIAADTAIAVVVIVLLIAPEQGRGQPLKSYSTICGRR
jgi:hypothetical protein